MSNPSTIWAQLAIPNPPIGGVPFVFTDNATIVTDTVNFNYTQLGASLSGTLQNYQLTVYGGFRIAYSDTTSIPGAATINKPAGRVKIAAGASTVVVTNAYCFASSIVQVQLEAADATLTRAIVTPANGSFTITGNAAATTATQVTFVVTNVIP